MPRCDTRRNVDCGQSVPLRPPWKHQALEQFVFGGVHRVVARRDDEPKLAGLREAAMGICRRQRTQIERPYILLKYVHIY